MPFTMKVTTLKDGVEINPDQFKIWLDALRSGKYPQGLDALETPRGFCCLGVACKVLIPEDKQQKDNFGRLLGTSPGVGQTYSPKWLDGISKDMNSRTATYEHNGRGLISLNDHNWPDMDNRNANFDEIADILEAVYVLGVLEEEVQP